MAYGHPSPVKSYSRLRYEIGLKSRVPLRFSPEELQIFMPPKKLFIRDEQGIPVAHLDIAIKSGNFSGIFITDEDGMVIFSDGGHKGNSTVYIDFGRLLRDVCFDPFDRGRQLRATITLSREEMKRLGR